MPALRSPLTIEERVARHRLIARDTIALSSLLAIVCALTFVTYLLFHSFSAHRLLLEQRWKARGESALANHQPLPAIESLRSALAYAPDDRTLQIELATALAAAGHTKEAVVYFDTLHEAEPGNGMINVQLARLAVIQGNAPLAITYYQAALDGTWNGDGFLRRREVRLELSRYLIVQHRFDEARSQLLIAAGNAADNHGLQLVVGKLLEQADGDADAYTLYRKAMAFSDTRTAGMIGAGRTAAAQNRYLLARNLLQQASTQADFARLTEDERAAVHSLLGEAVAVLDAFPAESLPPHVRAVRIMHALQVVRDQIAACGAAGPSGDISSNPNASQPLQPGVASAAPDAQKEEPPKSTPSLTQPSPQQAGAEKPVAPAPGAGPLRSAIAAVQRAGSSLARVTPAGSATGAGEVQGQTQGQTQAESHAAAEALSARWHALPPDATLRLRMEHDPTLLESTLQLVYDMERSEARFISTYNQAIGAEHATLPGCVPPNRDASLLMKIASAPDEIEQQ